MDRFKTFTLLIGSIHRSIRRIKMGVMTVYDLKSQHVSCLHYLYKEGPLTASELCELCNEDKANISRTLDYLEENGYLAPRPACRRYRTPLVLTDRGREVGEYLAERIEEVLSGSSNGVSDADRAVMYESLSVIDRNLQSICDKYLSE